MQRSSSLSPVLLVLVIVISAWATTGHAQTVTLEMGGSPGSVARGESLTLLLTLRNDSAQSADDLTLFAPLPTGLDQWTAEVKTDGGLSSAYPASGLIAVGSLSAGAEREFTVVARTETTAPSDLRLMAQVLGSAGRVAEASLRVNVNPSVDAGPDLIVDLGGSVRLDGASADDGDSLIWSVLWSDGGAGGTFDNPSDLHSEYTAPGMSGVVELILTATDEDGAESVDSMRLSVNAQPVADAGGDLQGLEGTAVSLDDATSTDPDGWIVGQTWSDGGAGGSFLPSSGEGQPIYLIPVFGGCAAQIPLTLTLTVIDDRGSVSMDSLELTVENLMQAPGADAGADREAVGDQTITLEGSASDSDGTIASVLWEQISGTPVLLSNEQTLAMSFNAPDVDSEQRLTFELTVRDDCDQSASDLVEVTLVPRDAPITPTPPSDENPSDDGDLAEPSTSELAVAMELTDSQGLPILRLAPPRAGEIVTIRVTATNTGETVLRQLSGALAGGRTISFDETELDPWESTRLEMKTAFGEAVEDGAITFDAVAFDPQGHMIPANASIGFFGADGETSLELALSSLPETGNSSDPLTISYTVTHTGGLPLVDLVLWDDRLGRIDLPVARIESGAVIYATAVDRPEAVTFGGLLERSATVSGFTASGLRVEAEATLATPIGIGGGGGSADATASVVIAEIAWAGSVDDRKAEWIELANPGQTTVDLSGWRLCWIESSRAADPIEEWTSVDLAGAIDPLPRTPVMQTPSFEEVGPGLWRVQENDSLNSVTSRRADPGFYLLERANDDAVANVTADLVYGSVDKAWDLPDRGAVILLFDPQGRRADSANVGGTGWPAGIRRSAATMERVSLYVEDSVTAWRSNPGLIVFGQSVAGTRLRSTAGRANGLDLEQWVWLAGQQLPVLPLTDEFTVSIPISDRGEMPWVQMAIQPTGETGAAGGGGAAAPLPTLTSERSGSEMRIHLDPNEIPAGLCFVWVTGEEAEAHLLLVRSDP